MRSKLAHPLDVSLGATAHAKREQFGAHLVALLASIPGQFGYDQTDPPLPAPSQFSSNLAFSVTSVMSGADRERWHARPGDQQPRLGHRRPASSHADGLQLGLHPALQGLQPVLQHGDVNANHTIVAHFSQTA
ncbi:hypothetical protein ACFY3M_00815 [Streptomyces mirabilis]|uniref:hypothetical protein n=1 Tax=Streptomyces mirabilis TaxID=68239 RepID=UPI00368EFA83